MGCICLDVPVFAHAHAHTLIIRTVPRSDGCQCRVAIIFGEGLRRGKGCVLEVHGTEPGWLSCPVVKILLHTHLSVSQAVLKV